MEITYDEFIQNILDTRGRFNCGDEYHERHHIVPKCMDGTNDEENLIDLFAREHFEVHRLLALENPDNEKLVYAWWCMCQCKGSSKKRENVSSSEYEEARIAHARVLSEARRGENHPMYGKPSPRRGKHHSEEAKKRMRANHADVSGEKHPWYGRHHTEESKRKNREAHKGRTASDETRKKLSEVTKGENNPNYGNHKLSGANNPRAKKVIRLSDLMIYDYLGKAAEENNMTRKMMETRCHKSKDFMYYDEWLTQQNNLNNND
jgi:hypothetical protein